MSAPWATAVAAAAVVLLPGAPAAAAERVVTITSEGVTPAVLEVAPGDTVRFVSQDPTFAYRAESTGGAWRFDSGPTALLDGDYLVPTPLVQPGTYTYRVAQDPPFSGSVVLPGPAGTVPPTGPAPAAVPAPDATASPGAASPGAAAPRAAPAVPGQLPAPVTARAFGLPVVLAVLLLVGATSLLVRLLVDEAGRAPLPRHERRA